MSSLSDFQILSKLGEGAYSVVYKVCRFSDNRIYALKKVKIEKLNDKEKKNALNEVRIMASIKHPNVISYKEAFFDEGDKSLCIIMEFADLGDLWQKIQRCIKRSIKINEKQIWSLLIQLTRGLKTLHDLGVFHRDLKSANVFLNRDGTIKLGDMNVSKVSKDGFLRTQTGTPYYASPEVWKDMKYNNKSDIWSLGCVIYEAITLKPPFRALDMEGLYDRVIQGEYERIPKSYSKDLADVLAKLLDNNPERRPSCDEILNMDIVVKHFASKVLNTSTSSLIKPIKVPKEISMLSHSLPQPDYGGFDTLCDNAIDENSSNQVIEENYNNVKLPALRVNIKIPVKHIEMHKIIESSSDRLRRIREIYLSPTNIYLSPQAKKPPRYVGYKKSLNGRV